MLLKKNNATKMWIPDEKFIYMLIERWISLLNRFHEDIWETKIKLKKRFSWELHSDRVKWIFSVLKSGTQTCRICCEYRLGIQVQCTFTFISYLVISSDIFYIFLLDKYIFIISYGHFDYRSKNVWKAPWKSPCVSVSMLFLIPFFISSVVS